MKDHDDSIKEGWNHHHLFTIWIEQTYTWFISQLFIFLPIGYQRELLVQVWEFFNFLNVSQFPRGGTLRIVPHHAQSLNIKKNPFAYQTQSVADPFHIQPILPWQPLSHRRNKLSPKIFTPHPFCTSWFFHFIHIFLFECYLISNNQYKDQNNSSLPWKLSIT